MWTVALRDTGLVSPYVHGSETESGKNARIASKFYAVGCHYVIAGVWDLPKTVEDIEMRMARGDKP